MIYAISISEEERKLLSDFFGEDLGLKIDFNKLMPVVYLIESLMPKISIPNDLESLKNGTHGSEEYIEIIALPLSTPIKVVYEAVLTFIKWYNNQSKV